MSGSQDKLKIKSGEKVKAECDDKKGDGKCLRAVMSIPKAAVGLVIGKGGMTLDEIRKETGARIDLDRRGGRHSISANHDGSVNATFFGSEEQLSQASIKVNELVASYIHSRVKLSGHDLEKLPGVIKKRLVVPSGVVGMIIGTRGENIKRMSMESGAHIALDNTPTTNVTTKIFDITGTPEACESARRAIQKRVPPGQFAYKDAVRQVVPPSVVPPNAVPRSAVPRSAVPPSVVPSSVVPHSVVPVSVVPRSVVPQSVVPSSRSNVTSKSNTGAVGGGVWRGQAQMSKEDLYYHDWIILAAEKPIQHQQGTVNTNAWDHLMKRADESGLTLQEAIREKDEDEFELGKQHMLEWIEYYREVGIPERVEQVKKEFRLIYGEEPAP